MVDRTEPTTLIKLSGANFTHIRIHSTDTRIPPSSVFFCCAFYSLLGFLLFLRYQTEFHKNCDFLFLDALKFLFLMALIKNYIVSGEIYFSSCFLQV